MLLSFARNLLAALAMVPVVRLIAGLTTWPQPGHTLVHAAVLMLALIAGVLVFAVVATTLGGDEVPALMRLTYERLQRPVSKAHNAPAADAAASSRARRAE